jgi:hypothetical protein
MSRRSLRPQLNQIRGWVRQGRTDAWIAHQLEVTVQQIQAFKREHDLEPDGDGAPEGPAEEVDLRAEDDAAIAAQLEAEAAQRAEEEARAAEEAARRAAEEEAAEAEAEAARAAADEEDTDDAADAEEARPRRRRSRAGRPRRRSSAGRPLEGTFDHGEEGYGLWLDPAVEDDPIYAEHWAGHRPVEVTIEEDQIVIRRAGGDEDEDDG